MREEPPIQSLITRSQAGDREAYDRLVSVHSERVRLFISSRIKLHIGPRIDVDEISQETFCKAYEAITRFEWKGNDSFFRWLCGTAKHILMNAAEKMRRCEPREDFHGIPAEAVSPSRTLRREERLDRLQKSLDGLPADYRQVVQLARIEGLKIKDIARRMNRSPDAIKHVLARALIQLRSNFGDTESLHLPDAALRFEEDDHDAS